MRTRPLLRGVTGMRTWRTALTICITAALALCVFVTASAAPRQSTGPSWLSIHTSSINESPGPGWRSFTASVFAWQSNGQTHGFVYVRDPLNNVTITGRITALSPLGYGYHYEGCGRASGTISGAVCFEGAGDSLPYGSPNDYFSIGLTSGGTGPLAFGDVPSGSVRLDFIAFDNFDDPSIGVLPNNLPYGHGYQDGQYVFQNDQNTDWGFSPFGPQVNNSELDVDGQVTGDPTGQWLLLVCRATDANGGGYEFWFEPADGSYMLIRQDPQQNLLAQGVAPGANTGNATNHLSLQCQGSTITAWVNGHLATSVHDSTYQTGQDAIGAAGRGTSALFDNLVVYP